MPEAMRAWWHRLFKTMHDGVSARDAIAATDRAFGTSAETVAADDAAKAAAAVTDPATRAGEG